MDVFSLKSKIKNERKRKGKNSKFEKYVKEMHQN